MKALVQRISKCLLRLTPGEASRALLFCCCHDGVTANWGDGHWCAVDGAFACLLCCDGCDVAKKRLALDGMTNGLPIKMLATSLILLLNVLVLGMTVRYSAVFEGQHRPHYPISGGTSTSSCFTRVGPIQTKSVSRVLELHVRWKRHTAIGTGSFFERLGKKLARHIGDRSGVPQAFWTGHWMIWWISVKCMDSIHGRCQHMIPECPTWANLPRIYDQAACGVCFSHVTPVKKNNHTGTTLGRRLVIFFRHGGRENYTQAIMHRVFTDFFYPVCSCVDCAPRTCSTLSVWILHVCWPQFPLKWERRTPTTSYAWQRTSCALVLFFQEVSFAPNLVWHLLTNHRYHYHNIRNWRLGRNEASSFEIGQACCEPTSKQKRFLKWNPEGTRLSGYPGTIGLAHWLATTRRLRNWEMFALDEGFWMQFADDFVTLGSPTRQSFLFWICSMFVAPCLRPNWVAYRHAGAHSKSKSKLFAFISGKTRQNHPQGPSTCRDV